MTLRESPRVTGAEMAQLVREGYFVRHGFFSPEELEDIERLADRSVQHHNHDFDKDTPYRTVSVRDGIIFVNELSDDSGVNEMMLRFALAPGIASFLRSVAGPRAAHHCWQVVYKFPHFPQPFPWHQDHIHTPADRPFYNMWIALSDMTVSNGCLRVLPGVGLNELLPYHDTPFGKSCWPFDDPNQGVPLEMKRGSIFMLTSRTLHMSGGNLTGGMRKAMLLAFVDSEAIVKGKRVRSLAYGSEEQSAAHGA